MPPQHVFGVFLGLVLFFQTSAPALAEASNTEKSYYSPIVRLEPEKGFFLITTDSGIQWIQVAEPVKTHLKTLAVGDMIDVVIEFRPDNIPPLLKSWKLARSASPCKVFNGTDCSTE